MKFKSILALCIYLTLNGCGSFGKTKSPNQAEAHLGQTLIASSETRSGNSLLRESQVQLLQIELINTELNRIAKRQNTIQARQLLFEIARKIDTPAQMAQLYGPGLMQTVSKTLKHVEFAAVDPSLEWTSRRKLHLTLARSDQILENINLLSTYTELGLSAELNDDLVELLNVVSAEISDSLILIKGGSNIDIYGLANLSADIATSTQRDLHSFDSWYFENFQLQPDNNWRFPKRKIASSDLFRTSGNDGNSFSNSGNNDDDDNDDDDDSDDDDDDD